jgi:MoxR-like ATPase
MYHGPTGTGKNTVWRLAMGEVFGDDFSLRTYRYFVQGSGGLEDIDFIGGYKKIGDRIEWIDGPLVRAMRDGKRFKIDEMNRLPARMLNVILDAMENSQIALTAKDGEIVNAAPGFAIDAMANIGDEYVGTERIDPSVMNRFTIKIEFDFLEPAEEKRLLRSRHPKLSATAADSLTVIAKAIRDAHAHGSSAVEVDMYVSPRALLNTAMLVVEGDSILDAVSTTWLADVAWSKAKRKSVIALVNLKAKKP